MVLRIPHYFDSFVCTAGECRDNCCYGGWQIDLDEDTVEFYKSVKGDFGDRLRASIDYTDTYCFKLENGGCPFLDDDNLCHIYKELGPEHMGVVCTQFPRFSEYYGHYKETGIGLACEEAARIILEDTKPFHIVERTIDEEEFEDEEYDGLLCQGIEKVRSCLFDVMNSDMGFADKLSVLLDTGEYIQELINRNDYKAILEYVPRYVNREALPYEEADIMEIWDTYDSMEVLNVEWTEFVKDLTASLHKDDYVRNLSGFNKENYPFTGYDKLVCYYLFRYLLQSVYDHDFAGKIYFMIANLILIKEMDIYIYKRDGMLTKEQHMECIHMFSREIEYSTDNLDTLSEEFLFSNIFCKERLESIVRTLF